MTYFNELAAEIEQGVPQELLPDGDTGFLFRLYALLALVKGTDVTAADVHNAWAVWMEQQDPDHRSIKPFEELSAETQASDEPFAKAIRAAAERLDVNPSLTRGDRA
jgi:hypothetical protein